MVKLDEMDTLAGGAKELNLALDETQLRQLSDYLDLLRLWNIAFNLVSRKDVDRLVPRHILDSLTAVPFVRHPSLLDVGSGAGFPGLPIAVANPSLRVVLLDRNKRKARFLGQAVKTMGLTNVEVVCEDLKASSLLGGFETVIARAVAEAEQLWSLTNHMISNEGCLLVMQRTTDQDTIVADQANIISKSHRVEIPGLKRKHEILSIERRM